MGNVPGDLRYTRDHEWARAEDGRVRVGITAYAQEQLGDVVFVELPKVGARVAQRQAFGVVESVKAVSDLFAPVAGEVVAVNTDLPTAPEVVNQDPYGRGWMIVIVPSNAGEWGGLLSAAQYEEFLAQGGH
ncbi:MAG: glycine cleavage system protein GcvH [Candidatus Rokubacteria bacterium]|nr:glycine cleavage system protein GcvH [Candidatus Rokubacteria bacterium]